MRPSAYHVECCPARLSSAPCRLAWVPLMRRVRVGIDVGGTFTDLSRSMRAAPCSRGSKCPRRRARRRPPSSPRSTALLGIVAPKEIALLSHSSTIATNALLGQMNLELPRDRAADDRGFPRRPRDRAAEPQRGLQSLREAPASARRAAQAARRRERSDPFGGGRRAARSGGTRTRRGAPSNASASRGSPSHTCTRTRTRCTNVRRATRAARALAAARRHALERRRSRVSRVRTHEHDCRQRAPAAARPRLPRASRDRGARTRRHGAALRDAIERRDGHARGRPRSPRDAARKRAGGGRDRRGVPRARARHRKRALVRYGRHDGEGRDDRRRRAADRARIRSGRPHALRARGQGLGLSGSLPVRRSRRGERGRRHDRVRRRRRRAARRAALRRRRPWPRGVRPRARGDRDRCESRARPPERARVLGWDDADRRRALEESALALAAALAGTRPRPARRRDRTHRR